MMIEADIIVLTVIYVYCLYKFLINNVSFAFFKIIIHLKTAP